MKFLSVSYTDTQNKEKADDPGDRFADTYGDVTVDGNNPPGEDGLSNEFQETAKQRGDGVLHSLKHISENNQNSHRGNHRDAYFQIKNRIGDHIAVCASCDETDNSRRKQKDKEHGKDPPDGIKKHSDPDTFFDSFRFSGSVILAGISSHCCSKGKPGGVEEFSKPSSAGLCGDIYISKGIDTAL